MTVSLRTTDCTQLTAQGDCVPLPFNLLQELCLAQAKPGIQVTSLLMLLSFFPMPFYNGISGKHSAGCDVKAMLTVTLMSVQYSQQHIVMRKQQSRCMPRRSTRAACAVIHCLKSAEQVPNG